MVDAGKRFLKDEAMVRRIVEDSRGGCYFLSFHRNGVLIYAVIVVNAERPADEIGHCLLEEMTQALGLPGDSDSIGPLTLHQTQYRSTLTAADKLLIRGLYDPRMAPNLPRGAKRWSGCARSSANCADVDPRRADLRSGSLSAPLPCH
jgi:hypothetical protein